MINVQRFVCNMLQENCYVVSDESRECVIIDCGAYYDEEQQAIEQYIRENRLEPKYLLATHGHLDHNFGNAFVLRTYGLRVRLAEADRGWLPEAQRQAEYFGVELRDEMPEADPEPLRENEPVRFGSHELRVVATPGHSQGSVTLYCEAEQTAFTGDTLFRHSIGRTDFEGGSMLQIIQSLRMFAQYPDSLVLLPGHGPQTTLGEELAHNPYMDR